MVVLHSNTTATNLPTHINFEISIMNEPNQTLYVANIDWKVKKQVLKRSLHILFSRHGKILDIIALRKDGLRGQAFVIFDNVQSATAALQAEQGFTFFGKDLKIQYAKEKSDRIAKMDGTFVPKDRRKSKDANKRVGEANDGNDMKRIKVEEGTENGVSVANPNSLVQTEEQSPPSNILFADSLPKDCNEMMLACLFRSYVGYKEVRIPRTGLAFIEFDDEPHATVAKKALDGFKLSADDSLNLKYGKS